MLFLDTSALLKRYLDEDGTRLVLASMDQDEDWVISALAPVEARITFCNLGLEAGTVEDLGVRLREDIGGFMVVPIDATCLRDAADIGCGHGVRTPDALHLAAARRLPAPVAFLTFDRRQATAAHAMGFHVPTIPGSPSA